MAPMPFVGAVIRENLVKAIDEECVDLIVRILKSRKDTSPLRAHGMFALTRDLHKRLAANGFSVEEEFT